jgi:hypothetical protein
MLPAGKKKIYMNFSGGPILRTETYVPFTLLFKRKPGK